MVVKLYAGYGTLMKKIATQNCDTVPCVGDYITIEEKSYEVLRVNRNWENPRTETASLRVQEVPLIDLGTLG